MRDRFIPQVLIDSNARPFIVFNKGRLLYKAVHADATQIKLVTIESLRDLRPLTLKGEPYPARKAASFYLNHDYREITKKARLVLKALVARKRQPEKEIHQ